MFKKMVAMALAVMLATVGLAGCGSKKQDGGSTAGGAEGGAQTTAPGGKIELRFIDVNPSPDRQAYYTDIFAKFEKDKGIKVNYESVPWDEAANKLTVLGSSKSMPDVMTTWAGWLGQFTQAKWVIPIDKYIEPVKSEFTDVVTNITWKAENQLYGATYTVPDGMMVKGIYVRKDWAEAAGLKLDPKKGWTYDEYFDAVAKMTKADEKHYGASYRGARGAFDPLLVYLEGFNGGKLYADDGSILINSDECLKAFEKWTDVYLKGYAPKDAVNWGFTEMVDNFTGGLTATLINDSEVAPTCEANMKPEQWMVMPMPSSKDGKIYNTLNAPYAYSISAFSKNPDAAWELINYLTLPENNIEYCKMGGLIPIKKDVANDPTYGVDGPYSSFVQQLNDPNLVVPCAFGPFDVTDLHQGPMHEEIQKYLLGKQDAKTSLDNICNALEERMKKYLEENPGSKVEQPKSIS